MVSLRIILLILCGALVGCSGEKQEEINEFEYYGDAPSMVGKSIMKVTPQMMNHMKATSKPPKKQYGPRESHKKILQADYGEMELRLMAMSPEQRKAFERESTRPVVM